MVVLFSLLLIFCVAYLFFKYRKTIIDFKKCYELSKTVPGPPFGEIRGISPKCKDKYFKKQTGSLLKPEIRSVTRNQINQIYTINLNNIQRKTLLQIIFS